MNYRNWNQSESLESSEYDEYMAGIDTDDIEWNPVDEWDFPEVDDFGDSYIDRIIEAREYERMVNRRAYLENYL